MDRLFPSLALAFCLSAAAPFNAAAQTDTAEPIVSEGLCTYSDRLAPLLEQGHVFIDCDRVEVHRNAEQVKVRFAFPARLSWVDFRGTFRDQGRFEISAFRFRSQIDWEKAEGQCEFVADGGGYSSVTCLSTDGPRFFVVNFVRAS